MAIIVDDDEGKPNQRPGLTACDTQVESWATGGEGREDIVYIIIIIITSATS